MLESETYEMITEGNITLEPTPHTSHISLIISIASSPSKREAEIPNPEIYVSDFFFFAEKKSSARWSMNDVKLWSDVLKI